MIIDSVLDVGMSDVFLRLPAFTGRTDVHLKLESLNPAGSIKFKPALRMVEDLETRGLLHAGRRVIESSSGNLGIALSIVARVKGYEFTCVTDPNVSPGVLATMNAYGTTVVVVTERDEQGGFLGTRLRYIEDRLGEDPRLVWPNQYANPMNTIAHYRTTAREIHRQFPDLDVLFVGAGTTGTLTGCAKYFGWHRPQVRVIAVDSVGSITFGGVPGRRHVPGLGTSRRPEIASTDNVADVVMIDERDTVRMCRLVLDRYGLLTGGSTGTVLCGVEAFADRIPAGATVVAISPDLGERYTSTLYDDDWLAARGLGDGLTDAV
ncbi:MAG TPA: 2,3-diaminopropionate biosynthesis protein SbnA [Mycobacteriales bacterium]|jgi:cysteine synthase A|nr:2,3-diaminopropionate biosynthesis protein SbnA [Mycobacteriales bacterium]